MGQLSYSITIDNSSDCPDEDRVIELVNRVFSGEGITWSAVGVILTDHQTVLELNRSWLQHDYETDVLSFLLEEDREALEGEVYVDIETARERHAEFEVSIQSEIERYIVHGLLHLAGHDDSTTGERQAMQRLEDSYLQTDS